MPERGLIIVYTGHGKGKTTAALGLALRAWGQGLRVLVLQFLKGRWETGELKAAAKMEGLEVRPLGEGFVRLGDEAALPKHRAAAQKAFAEAWEAVGGGRYDLVVLDEIFYAVKFGFITVEDILNLLEHKAPGVHLVLTGRSAPAAVIEAADLVTEMREVKHPYTHGAPARRGVEY
ncbi:MAG: cob(I)yrinic acid a,c-diamide adenosyltransferase [Bacillota bacterium]